MRNFEQSPLSLKKYQHRKSKVRIIVICLLIIIYINNTECLNVTVFFPMNIQIYNPLYIMFFEDVKLPTHSHHNEFYGIAFAHQTIIIVQAFSN